MRFPALLSSLLLVGACTPVADPPPITVTTFPATATTQAPAPDTTTTTPTAPLRGLGLETVAEGLAAPLFVDVPPGDDRLFVVEQPGTVRILAEGGLLEEPFLDVSGAVSFGGERGLLGLAFHPTQSERFFIHYSDRRGDTQVSEYLVSADPNRADPDSGRSILSLEQPAGNHNGGMLAFGPDGYLYLGLGDGGGSGDRFGHGQRPDTLLGTILRLDVDAEHPYGIPPDNPFVGGGGAPEVWAYGLRNPWRFAFDEGLIYVGDVGQNRWEEVNVAPADEGGLNYGWPILEGTNCFPPGSDCDPSGTVLPVLDYPIPEEGCAVIGGFVYRGEAIPELTGHYFYGDLCGGWVRSFRYQDGAVVDHHDWSDDLGRVGTIYSFGTDSRGELYVAVAEGFLYRFVPLR